jgi:carboxyl-terminal processing protease
MSHKRYLLPALCGMGVVVLLCTASTLTPKSQYGDIGRLVSRRLPREHLLHMPFDDAMSQRAWSNYVTALDYDRSYFLAEDIQRFRTRETRLDDMVYAGDVSFAFEVFEVYKERVRDRVRFVSDFLKTPPALDVEEVYRWKRKDAPWPADRKAWDEIWRQRVKNEYLARRVAATQETATNPVPATAATTNTPAIPPEEWILKRYQQVLTTLEDSDADWLLQVYLSSFARAYDPHSDYMSPSTAEDFSIEMKLSLVGIGALLGAEDGAAKVIRLIPGGPADRDKRDIHLQPNDKIIAVAQGDSEAVDTLHLPLSKVVRLIRGERGSKVVLTVIPASDATGTTTRRVDIIRDEVKLEEQAAKSRIENVKLADGTVHKMGVVQLPTFYADMKAGATGEQDYKSSARDVEKAVIDLKQSGAEGILIDLRSNGGGALLEAVRMTGLFIGVGPVVQVKEGLRIRVIPDSDPRIVYSGPLVVLVNRLSASASEIFAGALQDYGRALVVGDSKTHGKGSVQSLIELDRENRMGSLKITTAAYFRVSGGSTQLKGVTPDIILSSPLDFYPDLGEEKLAYPMPWTTVPSVVTTNRQELTEFIPTLRANSEKRRAADSHFAAYGKLLARLETINKTTEVPLSLKARLLMAKSERELQDMQKDAEDAEAEDVPDKNKAHKTPDLVLDEALRILADLAKLQPVAPQAALYPQNGERRPATSMLDWVQGL